MKRVFIVGGAVVSLGVFIIAIKITHFHLTEKKQNEPNLNSISKFSEDDDREEEVEELSEEFNPRIFEYIRMMRTPIGAGEDYNIEGETSIYEERQKALARRKQSLSRLTASQRRMFLRFEEGKNTNLGDGKQLNEQFSSAIEWRSRGPGNVPGRAREIVIMPNDPSGNTWLIGTVSGGVWKTTDAGLRWDNLTSDILLLSTSYLTVSAANPNVIYVGIGEPHAISDNLFGSGVFKSTDGGATWDITPDSEDFGQVSRMISDPKDEKTVVVATNRGLRRTTDGGGTWTDVSPSGTGAHFFQDLKAYEGNFEDNFNTQYAYGKIPTNIFFEDDRIYNGEIYKSVDGGNTWILVFTFQDLSNIDRAELAISRTNPNKVYASISIDENNSRLAVSTDGGSSWNYLEEQGNDLFFNFLGNQGSYDNTIMVHPFNDNIVYVAGVQMYRYEITNFQANPIEANRIDISTPYDIVFEDNSDGINTNVHVDHHNLKAIIGEGEKFRIINANDGGISLSDEDEDPGIIDGSWNNTEAFFYQEGLRFFNFDAIRGVVSSQFYAATKANGEDQYLGGMQDNSSFLSPEGESANANTYYKAISGGDGFTCLINYANPNEILSTGLSNYIYYSSDGGKTTRLTSDSFKGGEQSPFISWITNSNRLPDRVFSAHSGGVEVSNDFGQTWRLTRIEEPLWRYYASRNVRIAVNDYNPDVVIAGAAAGETLEGYIIPIQVSTNGGRSFNPKYINIETPGFFVSALNTSPTNDQVIYLGFQGRREGIGKLFRSKDLGDTWEDISGFSQGEDRGFPDAAVFDVIEMPYNDQIIWASTDIGIVCSVNGGQSWTLLDTDLPAVAVWDMQIVNDQVVLATYGRGIWTARIPEIENVNFIKEEKVSIFPNPFSDVLRILINERTPGRVKVFVYNESGAIVYQSSFQKQIGIFENKINLGQLATGFYVVVVSTPEGVKRLKAIKQ